MKTLKDHTIFYDEVCPMCNAYTKAFVTTGMLDENGRGTYQHLPREYANVIDRQRAIHEIALLNKQTGEVHYGISSMFLVIGHSFPFLRPVFACRPFQWAAGKVYKFISYNRRVILPSAYDPVHAPVFHLRYRLSFLVFAWLVTAIVLSQYSGLLAGLIPAGNFYREFMICGGQMIWQFIFVYLFCKEKAWDYIGNMMTISFAGGLLLLPILLISGIIETGPVFYAAWFLIVAALMLAEHIRRTGILGITSLLTITWVLYRIILLIFILYVG